MDVFNCNESFSIVAAYTCEFECVLRSCVCLCIVYKQIGHATTLNLTVMSTETGKRYGCQCMCVCAAVYLQTAAEDSRKCTKINSMNYFRARTSSCGRPNRRNEKIKTKIEINSNQSSSSGSGSGSSSRSEKRQ